MIKITKETMDALTTKGVNSNFGGLLEACKFLRKATGRPITNVSTSDEKNSSVLWTVQLQDGTRHDLTVEN